MTARREIPEGYADFALGKGRNELAAIFKTSATTISRWNVESGIARPPRREISMPADFATFAAGKAAAWLALHYKVSPYTICKWRRATGIDGCGRGNIHRRTWRHLPSDFAEFAHEHTDRLHARYGVSKQVIARWRREVGAKVRTGHTERPVPDDFAQLAPTMCGKHLMNHYGAAHSIIVRWVQETGIQPAKYVAPRREPRPRESRVRRRSATMFAFRGHTPAAIPPRDWTLHGCAAEHLRKYAATYRCGPSGAADQKGELYRYGNAILTPDELLQRAERLGWQPERWAA